MSMPTICRPRPISRAKLGGKLGIGENITIVQETFGKVFNEGTEFQRDGSQFDRCSRTATATDRRHDRPTPCTRRATRRPA
jgi:hypothetical protein